ncbi:hypothetical protein [Sphingobacterium sp.]|uniref:hypothetical protein n=1 Tax=Sphingobacterium sp. TaxID=341027 RepID=UPI0031D08A4E
MEQSLLSLVRLSIEQGYLPLYWHDSKNEVVKTFNGMLSLSSECVCIAGTWYHDTINIELFVYDEVDKRHILMEQSIYVFTGRHSGFFTHNDNEFDYFVYRSRYYTLEGLRDNDLVVMVDETIERHEDVYYWHSDNAYHYTPETYEDEEGSDDYNDYDIWEYHDGPCPPDYRKGGNEPAIGFEIEKGGPPAFCGHDDKEGLFKHTGCVMEADGTVDWELKTPIYPLYSNRIESEWLPQIKEAINAKNHRNAGGHIHLSKYPKTGVQLFDYCRPYFPLFMAMYPKRLETDYCQGKTELRLKKDEDKHQAIKIWDDRIELRFPAKVFNMQAIVFRLKFCRIMLDREHNSILSVILAAFDPSTNLGQLVLEVYAGKEKVLLDRILKVSKKYFNTVLENEKHIVHLISNLKRKVLCA